MANVLGKKLPTYEPGQLAWLKGDPTTVPVPGRPTIVELWASWCGPCRQVFPHLSKLQQEFGPRGLEVVGISTEQDTPQLRAFVQQQGGKMAYRVAASERVAQELMSLAQVSGIPHSFVVDSGGTIQFSGHPADPQFVETVKKVTILASPAKEPAEQKELPQITASREELSAKPIRELKGIMQERGVPFGDLNEKSELVDRILERCANVTYYAKS